MEKRKGEKRVRCVCVCVWGGGGGGGGTKIPHFTFCRS